MINAPHFTSIRLCAFTASVLRLLRCARHSRKWKVNRSFAFEREKQSLSLCGWHSTLKL